MWADDGSNFAVDPDSQYEWCNVTEVLITTYGTKALAAGEYSVEVTRGQWPATFNDATISLRHLRSS